MTPQDKVLVEPRGRWPVATDPAPEWVRLPGSRVWHYARVYLEGIVVFRCMGYREHSYPEDGAEHLPRGSRVCVRCRESVRRSQSSRQDSSQ